MLPGVLLSSRFNAIKQHDVEKLTDETNTVIKCIVWDLDNTLWDGIISENDHLIPNKKAIEAIKHLDGYGILHSISSKNNHEDAMAEIESMGLKDYFLFPQIGWQNKSESIRIIKEKLNIGFDAIAFIDDQPFERNEVNFVHPEVKCYDVDIIERIKSEDIFRPRFVTDESSMRRAMYLSDQVRAKQEETAVSNTAFLSTLEMKLKIQPATLMDLARVEELTIRTNQLNATGYTYSYDELVSLLESPDYQIYVAEFEDKYGTYGKIGIVMLQLKDNEWIIKLLLVSCRVMSRGVGGIILNTIINYSQQMGKTLFAEFMPTDRNRIMFISYKLSGFENHQTLKEEGGLLLKYIPQSQDAKPEGSFIKIDFIQN